MIRRENDKVGNTQTKLGEQNVGLVDCPLPCLHLSSSSSSSSFSCWTLARLERFVVSRKGRGQKAGGGGERGGREREEKKVRKIISELSVILRNLNFERLWL